MICWALVNKGERSFDGDGQYANARRKRKHFQEPALSESIIEPREHVRHAFRVVVA